MKALARNICFFAIMLMCAFTVHAQNNHIDSLKKVLLTQKADTTKVNLLIDLSLSYQLYHPDSCLAYAQKALALAETLRYDEGVFWSLTALNHALMFTANYPLELATAFKALSLSKKLNTPRATAFANEMLSDYYYNLGDYNTSLSYWHEVVKIGEKHIPDEMGGIWATLSRIYGGMNKGDSAMFYAKKGLKIIGNQHDSWQASSIYTGLGDAFLVKASYDSALFYYRSGLLVSRKLLFEIDAMDDCNGIASVYKATGKLDSAIWYAEKALAAKVGKSYPVSLLKTANILSDIYQLKKKPDSTLKYLRLANRLQAGLYSRERMTAIQNIAYKEQEKQKDIVAAKVKLRNQLIFYFSMAGLVVLLFITGIILRNKRLKQLQNIRNSIADDLHDDIGSTLSSIGIMSELAKAKSPEASVLLASIEESALNMQENMSDIVWAVNPKNDRFENVFQRMNQFASEILDAKNIELDFTSDPSLSALKITMEQRKNFYLFFKEAINNAAKYSDAKKVSVSISQKDHQVEMSISDNGKGFDTAKVFGGNGMSTFKKRGAELCADFKIQSLLKEGTVVKLKFKIT